MKNKAQILCVDDEWNGLEGRKMLFEQHGYDVLAATSGAQALLLFAAYSIDLVLLDYHMPPMNGNIVAERMKATRPDVPIAILSGDEGIAGRALECADAFVSKGESPANLLVIAEHLLNVRSLFSPLDQLRMGDQMERAA